LVERCVRDAEVASSNLVATTLGRGAEILWFFEGFRYFLFLGRFRAKNIVL